MKIMPVMSMGPANGALCLVIPVRISNPGGAGVLRLSDFEAWFCPDPLDAEIHAEPLPSENDSFIIRFRRGKELCSLRFDKSELISTRAARIGPDEIVQGWLPVRVRSPKPLSSGFVLRVTAIVDSGPGQLSASFSPNHASKELGATSEIRTLSTPKCGDDAEPEPQIDLAGFSEFTLSQSRSGDSVILILRVRIRNHGAPTVLSGWELRLAAPDSSPQVAHILEKDEWANDVDEQLKTGVQNRVFKDSRISIGRDGLIDIAIAGAIHGWSLSRIGKGVAGVSLNLFDSDGKRWGTDIEIVVGGPVPLSEKPGPS